MTWQEWAAARLASDRDAAPASPYHYPLPGHWPVRLLIKDESRHPTGSIKHRFARDLIADAVADGRITEGTPLVEATSGNMAVAEAYFAQRLGLPFTAVIPERTGQVKRDRITAYGGQLYPVDPPLAVYANAQAKAEEIGGHYVDYLGAVGPSIDGQVQDPDYALPAEILREAGEPPSWIVAGVGSGATSRSIGRYLRYHGYETKLAVVDAENSAYFPGWASGTADYSTGMPSRIEGIGRPRIEPAFDPDAVDLVIPVPDAAGVAAMRHLASATGQRFGPSTGAALWGALHLLHKLWQEQGHGSVVLIAADDGDPYASTYYDDDWTAGKGWHLTGPSETVARFLGTGHWPTS